MKVTLTKKVLVSMVVGTLTLGLAVGAYADTALKQVIAYQNSSLQVKVDGKQIDQASEDGTMYPLVFDGHSYVSAKSLAEALGATVKWNNDTQTVEVTSKGGIAKDLGNPTKDNSTKTNPSTTPETTPTSEKLTPVLSYSSIPDQDTLLRDFQPVGDSILNSFLAALNGTDNSALKKKLDGIGYKNSTFNGPEKDYEEMADLLVNYRDHFNKDEKEKLANGGALAIKNKDYNVKPYLKVSSDKDGFYMSYSYIIYYNRIYSTINVSVSFSNVLAKEYNLKSIGVSMY